LGINESIGVSVGRSVPAAARLAYPAPPPLTIDLFITLRQETQCNLRRVAEQRLPDKVPAFILDCDNRPTFRVNRNHIAAIDPEVSLSHAIGSFFVNSGCKHHNPVNPVKSCNPVR